MICCGNTAFFEYRHRLSVRKSSHSSHISSDINKLLEYTTDDKPKKAHLSTSSQKNKKTDDETPTSGNNQL